MEEPIENEYFNWLCAKVLDNSSSNYFDLLKILYDTEFTWTIPFDENRASDGIALREDFTIETGSDPDMNWEQDPCSILEVLISLAYRAQFQTDISAREWFWGFIENLGLIDYRRVSEPDVPRILNILNNFVWRNYDSKGHGGLFPMHYTHYDQREVEIWYQFNEYVLEKGIL